MARRTTVYGLVAFTTLGLAVGSATAAELWPTWRGPARTGAVPDGVALRPELPESGLAPLWQTESVPGGGSGGWSSPIVADGRAYLFSHTKTKTGDLGPAKYPWLAPEKRTGMTDEEYAEYEIKRRDEAEERAKSYRYEEHLYCFDLASGETIWKRTRDSHYSRFVQSGTPCYADGRIYVLGGARNTWCVDAESGETIWTKTLPGPFRDQFWCASFAVKNNIAVIRCGQLFALNAKDGTVLWSSDDNPENQLHGSPTVGQLHGENVIVANAPGGKTECRRLEDGQLLWEVDSGANNSTPIIANNQIITYGASRKGGLRLYAVADDGTVELRWKNQRVADQGSSPVLLNGAVYAQGDRRVVTVDAETGRPLWQTNLPVASPRYTSLVAGNDQVIYAWSGIYAMAAQRASEQLLYEGKINAEGVLFEAEDLETKIRNELSAEGEVTPAEFEKTWDRQVERKGPLACATPALADGKLIVRLSNRLACYDLQQE